MKLAKRLELYFASAESTLGHCGTFREGFTSGAADNDGAMVRLIARDEAHRVIRSHRALRSALAQIDPHARDVLFLAFGPERWPLQLAKALGKYTGVALVSRAAITANPKNPGAWLRTIVAKNDRRAIRSVQSEVNQLVQFALWQLEQKLSGRTAA